MLQYEGETIRLVLWQRKKINLGASLINSPLGLS
jgi:hypothetical protein